MAKMTHCGGCQQHYFSRETACPHCGAAGASASKRGFVRQAKMGGLMLFTALTTTACYGTPAMIDNPNGVARPGVEQPLPQVPKTADTAYVYLTPSGLSGGKTIRIASASVVGNTLTLTGADAAFKLAVTAPDATTFQTGPGVRDALPVEKMTALQVDIKEGDTTRSLKAPNPDLQGSLQISRSDEALIGGVLRLNQGGTVVEIYFLASR